MQRPNLEARMSRRVGFVFAKCDVDLLAAGLSYIEPGQVSVLYRLLPFGNCIIDSWMNHLPRDLTDLQMRYRGWLQAESVRVKRGCVVQRALWHE